MWLLLCKRHIFDQSAPVHSLIVLSSFCFEMGLIGWTATLRGGGLRMGNHPSYCHFVTSLHVKAGGLRLSLAYSSVNLPATSLRPSRKGIIILGGRGGRQGKREICSVHFRSGRRRMSFLSRQKVHKVSSQEITKCWVSLTLFRSLTREITGEEWNRKTALWLRWCMLGETGVNSKAWERDGSQTHRGFDSTMCVSHWH